MLAHVSDRAAMHELDNVTGLALLALPLLLNTESVLVLQRLLPVIHFLAALIDQRRRLVELRLQTQALLQLFLLHFLQCENLALIDVIVIQLAYTRLTDFFIVRRSDPQAAASYELPHLLLVLLLIFVVGNHSVPLIIAFLILFLLKRIDHKRGQCRFILDELTVNNFIILLPEPYSIRFLTIKRKRLLHSYT